MSPSARVFADQRPIPFTCQTITETHTTVKQQLTIYSASPKLRAFPPLSVRVTLFLRIPPSPVHHRRPRVKSPGGVVDNI
jgi:hypothetical protein